MFSTDKLACMSTQYEAGELRCPFAEFNLMTTIKAALPPLTCFLWTVIYALGFVGLFRAIDSQVWYCFLFAFSMAAFFAGNFLLQKTIRNSTGSLVYSDKMCVAFFFIYGLICN